MVYEKFCGVNKKLKAKSYVITSFPSRYCKELEVLRINEESVMHNHVIKYKCVLFRKDLLSLKF